jgi:outer membrane protein insertion porin family
VTLLLATGSLPALSQQKDANCDTKFPEEDGGRPKLRTHITRVKDAEGKTHGVISPVKELRVARLIFVGAPTLPISTQDEIALSVSAKGYDDDEDGLNELLERVRDAWQRHGFFKVEVKQSGSQTLSEDAETRQVAITVNVQAGKQYRLNEIHFRVTTPNPPAQPSPPSSIADNSTPFIDQQLRALFPIQDGEIFDTDKLRLGVDELRKVYGSRGYINFTALPTFTIDEDMGRITMLIELDEGKQFRYGKVEVTGMDPLVAAKFLQSTGLVSGNVFSFSHLEEFKKQTTSLLQNDFKAEDDAERRIDEKSGTVNLVIHVDGCVAP